MKKKIFSALLVATLFITSLALFTPRQFAKENNDVANLALMLPESDVIVALDMNQTLNVVGPILLNQDEKKIENLKKLVKSLENTIGVNLYDVKQVVAGVKVPPSDSKDLFGDVDFTLIMRTARSNSAMLQDWSKKMDAINAFDAEKEPTEEYIDAFKQFRYYKLSKKRAEDIAKLNKEFDEILQKTKTMSELLNELPKASKSNKLYKDSVKKNKALIESVKRFQDVLKADFDVKSISDSTMKLQNRWNEITLDDPKKAEKLADVLKEAKAIYPNYKAKAENVSKINSLMWLGDREFYEKLSKKNFGVLDEDVTKSPNEMMKLKIDEITDLLVDFPTAQTKQNKDLKVILNKLQRLEDAMSIRLAPLKDTMKFDEITQTEKTPKKTKSIAKSIMENAKIAEVNGKKMLTIDLDKVDLWGLSVEEEEATDVVKIEKSDEPPPPVAKPKTEVKTVPPKDMVITVDKVKIDEKHKDEIAKPEKKKELFAIGYLDETTMVMGFEKGIKEILNRKGEYKNPKAAEMVSSFKNPLISFATNSKIFEGFAKTFAGLAAKKDEEKKKETPSEKFFKDVNIFGSVEFDGDGATTNDIIMSLGFMKNKVEEIFDAKELEDESSVLELGDYQISKALFYDLLNTLKAYKASMSFKFEKQKLAALIEKAPQIIEEIKNQPTQKNEYSEQIAKTKIENIGDLPDILSSPKFYTDLFDVLSNSKIYERTKSKGH